MTVDPFTRTVSGGFGTGPLGAYTLDYDSFVTGAVASTFSVNGAAGVVAYPDGAVDPDLGSQYVRVQHVGPTLADSEQIVDISFASSAAALGVTFGVVMRYTSLSSYLVAYLRQNGANFRLQFATQSVNYGNINTSIPYGPVTLRLAVKVCTDAFGARTMGKVWRPGTDTEPAYSAGAWPFSPPASGYCGPFFGGGVSFGTGTVTIDNYTLVANPCGGAARRFMWIY